MKLLPLTAKPKQATVSLLPSYQTTQTGGFCLEINTGKLILKSCQWDYMKCPLHQKQLRNELDLRKSRWIFHCYPSNCLEGKWAPTAKGEVWGYEETSLGTWLGLPIYTNPSIFREGKETGRCSESRQGFTSDVYKWIIYRRNPAAALSILLSALGGTCEQNFSNFHFGGECFRRRGHAFLKMLVEYFEKVTLLAI